jgi:hypothetical protein
MKLRPFQIDKQNFNVDQILDLVCFRVKLFFFFWEKVAIFRWFFATQKMVLETFFGIWLV